MMTCKPAATLPLMTMCQQHEVGVEEGGFQKSSTTCWHLLMNYNSQSVSEHVSECVSDRRRVSQSLSYCLSEKR